MSTQQAVLACDNSSLANFKAWAQAISNAFAAFGWQKSSDTGQVNWSTISAVPPGFDTGGPFVYEVWQPNDGITPTFFLNIQYGNYSGANTPSMRFTLSTGTNGAGGATGISLGTWQSVGNTYTVPGSASSYECDFSGAPGRICVMMWRNGINSCQQGFAIERSVDSTGTYTNKHVTMIVCGQDGGPNFFSQQTLLFGVGAAPYFGSPFNRNLVGDWGGLALRGYNTYSNMSSAFNGSIGFDTPSPYIGYFDYPLTCCGAAKGVDIAEAVPFTVTLYGSSRTYLPSKSSVFNHVCQNGDTQGAWCIRWD